MKLIRIFPEMWASTLRPFSSSTRNIALGKGSTTVPSISMTSCFAMGSTDLLFLAHDLCQRRPNLSIRHFLSQGKLGSDLLVDYIVNPQVANVFSLGLGDRPPHSVRDVNKRRLRKSDHQIVSANVPTCRRCHPLPGFHRDQVVIDLPLASLQRGQHLWPILRDRHRMLKMH